MTGANRRAEFFAIEASEYLAELAPLAARVDGPDPERLVRGARALRGAALMAGLGTFARAAAALEGLARQVRDHAIGWEQARAGWREGLETLRGLTGRAASWEAADDRQALALAERLERITSGQSATPAAAPQEAGPSSAGTGLTPGVRAFIARESALIAGSLLEAARALAPLPPPEALAAVLERMRSLRGLGASAGLSPLPELLDAMEMTTRSLLGETPAPPEVAGVFADAADALAAMAKSVGDHGRVVVPPGLDTVAARLLDLFAGEHDVVAIAELSPGDQPAIVQRGTPPEQQRGDDDPIPVELVSVGDHLLLQAEALARHTSPSARDLRLFALHQTLAAMPRRGGTGRFLSPLARAITRAIGNGTAKETPDRFLTLLRDSGRFLVDAAGAPPGTGLTSRRDRLAHELDPGRDPGPPTPVAVEAPRPDPVTAATVGPPPEAPGGATAADLEGTPIIPIAALAPEPATEEDPPIVAIESLAPDHDDGVPIESLAPRPEVTDPDDDATLDVVAIEALAYDDLGAEPVVEIGDLAPDDAGPVVPDDAPGVPGRLETAYARLGVIERERGDEPASLPGLTGEAVLPIDELLLRGERALARAEEVRNALSGILAEPTVSLERLRPLLDELLDLVPLARDAA